jgi:hypothetical protein
VNGEYKITGEHRSRLAAVYLRQSSMAQVRENTESTARQYALADEAVRLGWARTDVIVIDTDLGVSGRWGVARAGFTDLVGRVRSGEVGAIFGLEISRPEPAPRALRDHRRPTRARSGPHCVRRACSGALIKSTTPPRHRHWAAALVLTREHGSYCWVVKSGRRAVTGSAERK